MHLLQVRRKRKKIMLINRPRKQKERQIELNNSCNCRFKKIKPSEALEVLGAMEGQEYLEVPVDLKVLRVLGGLEVQENLWVPKVQEVQEVKEDLGVSEVLEVGDLALN